GRPYAALGVIAATFVLSGAAATRFGSEFLPEFQETDFLMHFIAKPGASVDEMARTTLLASRELRAIPGVRNFGSHIGRAEVADEVYGPNFTELWISVDPQYDLPATVKQIQATVDGYPGLKRDLLTYLKERIKEVLSGAGATIVVRTYGPDLAVLRAKGDEIKKAIEGVAGVTLLKERIKEVLSGAGATIVVRTYGPDLAVLRAKGDEIKKAIEGVAGVTNLKVEPQVLVPQVQVRLRPDAASRFGLSP